MNKLSMDYQGAKSYHYEPIYIDREKYFKNQNPMLDKLFIKMRKESERLKTFTLVQWPNEFISKEDLAKAGFFYLLNRDCVQCAFCEGRINNWRKDDDAFKEHFKNFPRCDFLLGYDVGNLPLKKDPIRDEKLLANLIGRATCECGHDKHRSIN